MKNDIKFDLPKVQSIKRKADQHIKDLDDIEKRYIKLYQVKYSGPENKETYDAEVSKIRSKIEEIRKPYKDMLEWAIKWIEDYERLEVIEDIAISIGCDLSGIQGY